MEAGVAGEGQFDGGAAQRPPDDLLVGVADDEPQQGARGLLGRRRRAGRCATRSQRTSAGGDLASASVHLLAHERGLGLDVEAGEHEGDLVAEAAEAVEADLEGGRRGLAAYALDADAVGAVLGEPYGVQPGGDVGPAYRAPPVSYSSWAVTVPTSTKPPVPGCLVMTQVPSAWSSARGKPGRRSPQVVAVSGRTRSCRRSPAPRTPARARRRRRPRAGRTSPGPQPKWAAAGPVTRAASVTRPVTTMSAPSRRQAAMPKPPR